MGKVEKVFFLVVLLFGIVMRMTLFSMVSVEDGYFQHDVMGRYGHLDYIETIYKTGRLPEINSVQYYHPPLHHIISAGVLRILMPFMGSLKDAEEGLKVLALVYSVLLLVVIWKITGEINLSKRVRRVILLIYLIHPTLVLMSISINNDPLSILLIHYSLLLLIRWWKKPSVKLAGVLGLFTGLAVMTKASGMVLFLVEFLALMVKFLERKDKKRIWRNYAKMALVFMLISLPIGLWYPVRNYMKFGQELTYVLDLKNRAEMMRKPVIFGTKKEEERFLAWQEDYLEEAYIGEKEIFSAAEKRRFYKWNYWGRSDFSGGI
ncbi:MAG: glycosyltransferase family 39 protein [Candidatus Saccharibacteria bacterium]|nr:glycosyltransferase family 39 protein [Candidatus Saccharibacteria bacterium]